LPLEAQHSKMPLCIHISLWIFVVWIKQLIDFIYISAGVPRHLLPSPRGPSGIRVVPVIVIPVQLSETDGLEFEFNAERDNWW